MDKCVDINLCLTSCHGKPTLALEILTLLLDELPRSRREINLAFDESRFADARDQIHKLHGACCYCGVPELKAICKKIERQLNIELKTPDLADRHTFDHAVDELLVWRVQHNIQDFFTDSNK